MKRKAGENYALLVLNVLMRSGAWLTTNQVADLVGCERKTVYKAMDQLEIRGFGIEKKPGGPTSCNKYRFRKVYGL